MVEGNLAIGARWSLNANTQQPEPFGPRSRFPIDARLDGRTFVKFHVDLGVGDDVIEPPDRRVGWRRRGTSAIRGPADSGPWLRVAPPAEGW